MFTCGFFGAMMQEVCLRQEGVANTSGRAHTAAFATVDANGLRLANERAMPCVALDSIVGRD
eukprot:CAMPEP_0114540662 /NCGR_PEP_ID=MMETSP0114-20121206/894_1 /TAXON_ID=31324 /ORGANISM="Goniomonas sp, Strain m" /LENGTH=61 /DNA_ID=CAMNT_0001724853 /DNA_START=325 /DNA_END=507 /DNA_ORIENTATION=+